MKGLQSCKNGKIIKKHYQLCCKLVILQVYNIPEIDTREDQNTAKFDSHSTHQTGPTWEEQLHLQKNVE